MTTAQDFVDFMQLLNEYEFALDEGDADGVAACFVEDGLWGSPRGSIRGAENIREAQQKRHDTLMAIHPDKPISEFRRHHVTSPFITVDADGLGHFRAYFLGTLRRGNTFHLIVTGHYHGTVVRVDGAWRFRERWAVLDSEEAGWWPPSEHE